MYMMQTCGLPLQFERVRVIYKYALDRIPKSEAQELFKNYTMFEKKFGDRRGIEDVIVSKRRFQYEEEVKVENRNLSLDMCRKLGYAAANLFLYFILMDEFNILIHSSLLLRAGKPTQLWRLVWLSSSGGEWCWLRHGQRGLWESHRQHPPHPGEATLETIYLPVDQLRAVRRAGGQGQSQKNPQRGLVRVKLEAMKKKAYEVFQIFSHVFFSSNHPECYLTHISQHAQRTFTVQTVFTACKRLYSVLHS